MQKERLQGDCVEHSAAIRRRWERIQRDVHGTVVEVRKKDGFWLGGLQMNQISVLFPFILFSFLKKIVLFFGKKLFYQYMQFYLKFE